MRLSEELALKYARYRLRFLEGSLGTYQGPQETVHIEVPGLPSRSVASQRKNTRASFLRNISRPVDEPGAFIVSETRNVQAATASKPGDLESADIGIEKADGSKATGMKHGDNIIHASWAFLTFVAEYVITFDPFALRLANNILASFQRLGNYAPGFREPDDRNARPAGESWGYMLRADAVDDDSENQRLQKWLEDPSAESSLEPSPDQYTSLFCAARIARKLLADAEANDAEWPTSADHDALRRELNVRLTERVRAGHRYLAQHCRYLLKHREGRLVKRGAWCWQFAYEFAKTASAVLEEPFDQHFQPFLLDMLPDIISAFVHAPPANFAEANAEHLAELILSTAESVIFDQVLAPARDTLFGELRANIPILDDATDLLSFLDEWGSDLLDVDVDARILEVFRHWIDVTIRPLLKNLLRVAIQAMLDAGAFLNREASIVFSKWLFEVFASVVFTRPLPVLHNGFVDAKTSALLFESLGLFSPDNLISTVELDISIPIKTKGFTIRIAGINKQIGSINWGTFHLDGPRIPALNWRALLGLALIPSRVHSALLIYLIAEFLDLADDWINEALNKDLDLNPFDADFMPFGYFVLMAVNGSFEEHLFDERDIASQFQNGLFAALNYRLLGHAGSGLEMLQRQLGEAPNNFPNGRSDTIWDEDFLWLRDRKRGDDPDDQIYSGIDFLSAAAVAASADSSGNRATLKAAIEKVLAESLKIDVLESPGVFNLPFRGPIVAPMPVLRFFPPELNNSSVLYIAVVFAEPGAPGLVGVRLRPGNDPDCRLEFSQEEPGRVVVIPASPDGIVLESADTGVSGALVVGLDSAVIRSQLEH